MADVRVGPFLVRNANVAQINDVRAVAAKLPANMQGGTTVVDFGRRPNGAPPWAQGFNQGANAFWIDGSNNSKTRQYDIAHEYWHSWSRTHSEQEAQARQLVVGPAGHTETRSWTNDPDEGLADAFARALGFNAIPNYDFRAYVPSYQYGHFLSILGGTSTPPPTGTPASYDPNSDSIKHFLNWWSDPAHFIAHNAASSWSGILNEYTANTGDAVGADHIKSLLLAQGIDINVATGIGPGTDATLVFIQHLKDISGWTQGGGLLDFGGLFGGLGSTSDPNSLLGQLSHGFYFLVILIIGVVLLLAGFKARQSSGETA